MVQAAPRPVLDKDDAWTVDDLAALDVQDWWRYEIVDGTLVVSPAAGGDHELASEDLRAAVRDGLPDGYVIVGPLGIDIPPSFLVPDLLVARRDDVRRATSMRPQDLLLVVEVVSPGSTTMDRVVKPAKYASVGIPNYWRVETDPPSLTAYRLSGEGYVEVGTWGAGEAAEPAEPFPVTVPIDQLG